MCFSPKKCTFSLSASKSYLPSFNKLRFFKRPVLLIPLIFQWRRFPFDVLPQKVKKIRQKPKFLPYFWWRYAGSNRRPLECHSTPYSKLERNIEKYGRIGRKGAIKRSYYSFDSFNYFFFPLIFHWNRSKELIIESWTISAESELGLEQRMEDVK